MVPVRLVASRAGLTPDDPYVRRFWVAALGSGAIAELLRLVRAAEKGEGVRLPRYLPQLMKAGLVTSSRGALVVKSRIPPVPRELRWRFPPTLAGEHSRWVQSGSVASSQHPHQYEGNPFADSEPDGDA